MFTQGGHQIAYRGPPTWLKSHTSSEKWKGSMRNIGDAIPRNGWSRPEGRPRYSFHAW